MNIKKVIVGFFVIIGTILASSYLWYRFDQSDIRHAIEGVKSWPANKQKTQTWEELVSQYYKVEPHEVSWQAKIDSRTQGTLIVHAFHPDKEGEFIWKVQLVWAVISVEPTSDLAIKTHNSLGL